VDDTNIDDREAPEIARAVDLIHLGARLHLLESETPLSRERLLALYEEVTGIPPAEAGPLAPAEWFLHWQPNVHASLFIGIWRYLQAFAGLRGMDAIARAYRLYMAHMQASGIDPILTVTRAWTVVRYLGVLLSTVRCGECGHEFVVDAQSLESARRCGLCRRTPSSIGPEEHTVAVRQRPINDDDA